MADPYRPNKDLQHIPEVKEGYVINARPVKWVEYRKDRNGKRYLNRKGRWKAMDEYGGWENCDTPAEVWPEYPDYRSILAELKAAEKRADEARNAALREAADVADKWATPTQRTHGHGGPKAAILAIIDKGDDDDTTTDAVTASQIDAVARCFGIRRDPDD